MKIYKLNFLFFICLITYSIGYTQENTYKTYSIKDGLPQSNVVDAVQDDKGYIWFATQGGGLAKFDGLSFMVLNQNNGLKSNYINSLFYKKDSLFIASNSGLSIKYKTQITHFNSPKINRIVSIKDAFFLATNQGIYQFKTSYILPLKINLKIDLSPILDITYKNASYWVKTKKEIWKINSLTNPTFITKATNKEVKSLHKNYTYNFSISDEIKSITNKIFKDRDQNFWILTSTDGIYKPLANSFTHINNINNTRVRSVKAIHLLEKDLFFTDGTNIYKKDSIGFKLFNRQNQDFNVTSITSDKLNNLWFGSENNGIFIYRKHKDSTKNLAYKIENLNILNGLPVNNIQNIILNDNYVWITSKNAGIFKLNYDFENGIVKSINRFNNSNGLRDVQITNTQLYNNRIWYATRNGAIGFIKDNAVTQYSAVFGKNTEISSFSFKNNDIYIGTQGIGLFKASIGNINKSQKINDSFLSSQNIHQVLVDNNTLWIGSEKGLDKIDLENNLVKNSAHFNASDGFLGIETSSVSIKDKNNVLWFGTLNGITKYEPKEIKINNTKPDIFFEEISIGFQPIDSIRLRKEKNVIQLKPNQNTISLTYKTIDFNYPERIQYQYEINGEKSRWTKNNNLNLANLKPDLYIVKVRARISNSQISNTKEFTFYIDKPLFEKTWFLWLISIVGFLIVLFSTSLYVSGIKKRNQEKIDKLTLEKNLISLEQKALQLQMNPHFIFNVLNGIKALGNSGKTDELNATVSKFAILLRSVLQNSRKEEVNLKEEIETLTNYLDLEKQLSSTIFDYNIKINIKDIDIEEILIPSMLIQPFIENSIKHGFVNSSEKNLITINFRIHSKFLYCSVIDNGIGFVQSQKQKTNSTHKSIALKVTKERIKNLSKFSNIEIKELKENNIILGTKVEFKIPLKTDF